MEQSDHPTTMKSAILTLLLITLFALLIWAMQDPMILAGGSETGELILAPDKSSQWFSLLFFAVMALFPVRLIPLEQRIARKMKSALFAISVLLLMVSGHTYRYSDRAHALVDIWYFLPVQSLRIDPDHFIVHATYRTDLFFISVFTEGHLRQLILTGPGPFGIERQRVAKLLQDFDVPPEGR